MMYKSNKAKQSKITIFHKNISGFIVGCGALAILVVVIYVTHQDNSSVQASSGISTQTVLIDASWAGVYPDLKSLKHGADIILSGTITGIKGTKAAPFGSSRNLILPLTDYQFTVEKTAWDPNHLLSGDTITIRQTGGVINSTKYMIDDDPLFAINEHLVLALHQFIPGNYFVIGGPSGRFEDQNGIVSSARPGSTYIHSNETEDEFFKAIQDA